MKKSRFTEEQILFALKQAEVGQGVGDLCRQMGITHDYIRHGTTTLFAALDVANGTVITQCKARHRHQEFLSFLRHIEASVREQLDVHLIADNYGTHKHARV
jgi:transposase